MDRLTGLLEKLPAGLRNGRNLALIFGIGWLLLIGLLWLATSGLQERWPIGIFLGRFHILVVHLPIGLIFGVAVVEAARFVPALRIPPEAATSMLWLATFGAAMATVLGFLLMVSDQFSGSMVSRHMWTGLAVFALFLATLILKIGSFPLPAYLAALAASLTLTGVSGHFGGNMVHGESYLTEYAPEPLATVIHLVEGKEKPSGDVDLVPVSQRIIYDDIIQPIFDAKCVECHYEGKVKGKLRMDSFEQLARGGDYGESFVPGDAEASELYYRITLDPDDDDFMPPEGKGDPMTEEEVLLVAWWINSGASPTMTIEESEPTESTLQLVEKFFSSAKLAQGSDAPSDWVANTSGDFRP